MHKPLIPKHNRHDAADMIFAFWSKCSNDDNPPEADADRTPHSFGDGQMGMTVWFNVRDGDKHESDGEDRSAIFDLHEQLDMLATKLSVEPISTFFDETDLRYNMDENGEFDESEEGWPASAATWHDPQNILRTVQALCNHMQSHESVITAVDGRGQSDVLEELRTLVPVIKEAVAAGRAAHLLVIM